MTEIGPAWESSDAVSEWPLLYALLNTASDAAWPRSITTGSCATPTPATTSPSTARAKDLDLPGVTS